MFHVFDCTKSVGTTFRTRSKHLAHAIAVVCTWATGRMYDYDLD